MPHVEKRHFLLDRLAGWRADSLDRVLLAGDGAELRLRSRPGTGRPLAAADGDFGGLSLPTGLAVDAEDRVYILDAATLRIRRFDPCSRTFATLPGIGGHGEQPRQLDEPHGIAISPRGDLYLADTGNRRVQVFSTKGQHLRAIWGPLRVVVAGEQVRVRPAAATWSVPPERLHDRGCAEPPPACELRRCFPEGTWEPWDIVVSPRCWAYVSDRANGLIHCFDPHGRWRRAFREEESGIPFERPTQLALDQHGRLYVIQEGKSYVVVLDERGELIERVEAAEQLDQRFEPSAVAIDAHGNLCLSERFTRSVYLYCLDREGRMGYAGRQADFEGVGEALVFDRSGNALLADAAGRRVVCLPARAAYEIEGSFISEPLDSQIYRCLWHRVVLDARIPAGSFVRVDTFTAEAPKTLAEIRDLPESRWATGQTMSRAGDGKWDCLIQSPRGRFLWLRLTLIGDGADTPAIRSARVYYPRVSSLQYLPAVYQADADSADFLDRFLSIFDTLHAGIAGQIDDIARYFDPAAAPAGEPGSAEPDFLTWLAAWLGLTLERHWPLEKRRRLLALAHRLYELRGTPAGLRLHIEIYTGVEPQIVEHYRLRNWLFLGEQRLGDQAALWGAAVVNRLQLNERSQIGTFQLVDSQDPQRDPFYQQAHQFTVFIPQAGYHGQTGRQTLERIVEMAKPAHTQGHIHFVETRFRVGAQALVGVDTVIGRYPRQVIESQSQLGYDAVIGQAHGEDRPPAMRIGQSSQIGTTTLID